MWSVTFDYRRVVAPHATNLRLGLNEDPRWAGSDRSGTIENDNIIATPFPIRNGKLSWPRAATPASSSGRTVRDEPTSWHAPGFSSPRHS